MRTSIVSGACTDRLSVPDSLAADITAARWARKGRTMSRLSWRRACDHPGDVTGLQGLAGGVVDAREGAQEGGAEFGNQFLDGVPVEAIAVGSGGNGENGSGAEGGHWRDKVHV